MSRCTGRMTVTTSTSICRRSRSSWCPSRWVPKPVGEVVWFALTAAMAAAFVRLSLIALPDRRRSAKVLVWLTVLLTGKFFVKELAFGQFNLPVGLLLIGAVIAAQHGRGLAAGAAIAAGVFVKPYALVLVPWLARTFGWRPFVPFTLVMAAGLILPALSLWLGWQPDAAARVVSHRHRHYGAQSSLCRQHLVRLDVGEVARPGPPGQHSCARLCRDRCRGGRRHDVSAPAGGRTELSGGRVLSAS